MKLAIWFNFDMKMIVFINEIKLKSIQYNFYCLKFFNIYLKLLIIIIGIFHNI